MYQNCSCFGGPGIPLYKPYPYSLHRWGYTSIVTCLKSLGRISQLCNSPFLRGRSVLGAVLYPGPVLGLKNCAVFLMVYNSCFRFLPKQCWNYTFIWKYSPYFGICQCAKHVLWWTFWSLHFLNLHFLASWLGEGNLNLEWYPNLRKHSTYHPNTLRKFNSEFTPKKWWAREDEKNPFPSWDFGRFSGANVGAVKLPGRGSPGVPSQEFNQIHRNTVDGSEIPRPTTQGWC